MKTDVIKLSPPKYCKYSSGICDQQFDDIEKSKAFFIYPSQPPNLANTIKQCVDELNEEDGNSYWKTWEDLSIVGKIIFCQICKVMRGSESVIANITNLNFNVLFELGFAIGLKKPVLTIKDTTYDSQKVLFDELGIFDTLGYEKFTNSDELKTLVRNYLPSIPSIMIDPEINKSQPIFYVKSPIDNDGSVRLSSCLKKSWYKFRTFDIRETPRLSLHDAYKQVLSSLSVVVHLIDPERAGALVHNARAAFVCGMALASGKHVLMFQEGSFSQPIDYREVVVPYNDIEVIPYFVESLLRETTETLQVIDATHVPLPTGLLERIDLGDIAAENEINALQTYFVKTPQFQQARQGHARLVIGRKGTGKTALFYGIRGQYSPKGDKLVLDLKPEGHQFIRLREMVLNKLSEGLQEHTLTAFWYYLLLLEMARKVIDKEQHTAYQDPELLIRLQLLESLYKEQFKAEGDFSERLMALVNRIIDNFPNDEQGSISSQQITNLIYSKDIKKLNDLLFDYLDSYDGIVILFDNIDKGFPSLGLTDTDVRIIRCLLEATRKIQDTFSRKQIQCLSIVFLRKDVYDLLVNLTSDRGKETYVNIDWSDIDLIKELLLRRIRYQVPELGGSFEDVWSRIFDPHIEGENSFTYLLSRTFLRPRDVLNIVRKCIQISVSHGHDRVTQEDVMLAEEQFSVDMLDELRYEIRDIFPDLPDFALSFLNVDKPMSADEVDKRLLDAGVAQDLLGQVKNNLLWFSFLGLRLGRSTSFAHEMSYDVAKLEAQKKTDSSIPLYVIHSAFKKALTV